MGPRPWGRAVVLAALACGLGVASCQGTSPEQRLTLAGPLIPGAEYVGMELCVECHRDVAERFRLTSHAGRSLEAGERYVGEACESCHGAGSRHVENVGDPTLISRGTPDRCFVCHVDKRAEFQLQYHHPVPEGWLSCTACHTPHGDDVGGAWALQAVRGPSERCTQCHKEQKGPFVFEHDPVRAGCRECHNPHGSVFEKLLVADGRVLCLRCHWEPSINTAPGLIGDFNHANFHVGRGSDCVDCHTAPHGSNIERAFLH